MSSPRSKVEIGPTEAPYYDLFMNVISLGYYPHLIKKVVDKMIEIISNAYRALKPGGVFCILDYNEFDLERLGFPLRWVFIRGECQLASEFLRLDLKKMLSSQGFTRFQEELFLRGYLRLLRATR